jgi:DNA primase
MKIDEEGLTALVNKHIRERIQTEEKKQQYQQAPVEEYIPEDPGVEDLNDLLSPDEKQEHAMVRALMEFGTRPWDESITVADHVFTEIEENGLTEMIDNKQLVRMIDVYREMYQKGEDPGPKSFLYHPDQQLNQIAVSLMDNSNFEISHHWKTSFDRHTPSRDEVYREEVLSCMNYLKLRKIKRLIAENQRDMERATNAEEQLNLIEVHQHLKELEIQLARNIGTVIIK